jgi:hypothetical protein
MTDGISELSVILNKFIELGSFQAFWGDKSQQEINLVSIRIRTLELQRLGIGPFINNIWSFMGK